MTRFSASTGYAQRDGLRIHLRASPEIDPFSNYVEVYVETAEVDQLHEEWQTCGLLAVSSGIGPALKAEVRCRWDAGTPVGLMSEFVEDKPWGVLTAAPCKTASDHHARVGWDAGVTGCRAGVETARGEQAAAMYFACTSGTPFVYLR